MFDPGIELAPLAFAPSAQSTGRIVCYYVFTETTDEAIKIVVKIIKIVMLKASDF